MFLSISSRYLLVPERTPCYADAATFRFYWQRQRHSRWCSRPLRRQLAHDYWVARHCAEAAAAMPSPVLVAAALMAERQPATT